MKEYLNVNKSKFGENMIKHYEMKNVLQMFDAYNKNDLKIKTIILTDDAILEMNNLIKEEKEIILDKSVFKIDKVIRKNINPLTSNYIIMLKLKTQNQQPMLTALWNTEQKQESKILTNIKHYMDMLFTNMKD